ncbi:MAG: hypothetical protein AAF641_04350 [Pseudomonadota bacterium]
MQTSLLLPLILLSTNGPAVPTSHNTTLADAIPRHYAALNETGQTLSIKDAPARGDQIAEIFDGCRPPVLDPREASKILYQRKVDGLHDALRADLPRASEEPLFISRCGSEFVLFHRRAADQPGDILYLRFKEGSFELLEEAWG